MHQLRTEGKVKGRARVHTVGHSNQIGGRGQQRTGHAEEDAGDGPCHNMAQRVIRAAPRLCDAIVGDAIDQRWRRTTTGREPVRPTGVHTCAGALDAPMTPKVLPRNGPRFCTALRTVLSLRRAEVAAG